VLSYELSGRDKIHYRAQIATVICAVALPILGFISIGMSFLAPVVILGIIFMVGFVLYYAGVVMPKLVRATKDMRRIDPLFSNAKFEGRVDYLLSVFFGAMSYNPHRVKQFIDPYVFDEIMQNFNHTGNIVLSFDLTDHGKIDSITKHGGRIYLPVSWEYEVTILDSYKRVHKTTKLLTYQLYRAESAMTKLKPVAEAPQCSSPGCARAVNLTANGKCKYCGADYDISQIDWMLGRVDANMFI
jgi:hypothetical protein